MKMTGEFRQTLNLGDLGEHDAQVEWDGYRAQRPAEDDYNEMTIVRVTLDLGKNLIDVTSLLSESTLEDLCSEAWEHFPTLSDLREEAEAEAIDHYWNEHRDAGVCA